MTYDEAIRFWFGRVNYEQNSPRFGDFKLDRMRGLLELLGNPQNRLLIVHVAGSKGKGSTSAFIASILRSSNRRTGLFTSPHLVHVEERIQVDGVPIAPEQVAEQLTAIRAAIETGWGVGSSRERELTFFEIGTALAFRHFARQKIDVAVLEVGLGGRFDSTNVCDPALAMITSISLDHTQMLGDTLGAIAFEKAGIIKPGRPTISGVRAPEARDVIRSICKERGSRLIEIDSDFHYRYRPALIRQDGDDRKAEVDIEAARTWSGMQIGLVGAHQAANAALAAVAAEELLRQGFAISEEAVRTGLAGVSWPARLEVLGRRPLLILDCAHNVASAEAMVEALRTSFPVRGQSRLVFAGSRDKDLAGMLTVLARHFDRLYLTRFANNSRSLPPEELAQLLPAQARERASLHPSASAAWMEARAEAHPDDLICAAGSVFLAGELRALVT